LSNGAARCWQPALWRGSLRSTSFHLATSQVRVDSRSTEICSLLGGKRVRLAPAREKSNDGSAIVTLLEWPAFVRVLGWAKQTLGWARRGAAIATRIATLESRVTALEERLAKQPGTPARIVASAPCAWSGAVQYLGRLASSFEGRSGRALLAENLRIRLHNSRRERAMPARKGSATPRKAAVRAVHRGRAPD
jgi:hypothetical protein